MINYRKFYEKELGIKIPKDFDVHHLDYNRENNDLHNLVAIPKNLHKSFHLSLYNIWKIDASLEPLGVLQSGNAYFENALELLNTYSEDRRKVSSWIDFRDFQRKILPNIHNLSF